MSLSENEENSVSENISKIIPAPSVIPKEYSGLYCFKIIDIISALKPIPIIFITALDDEDNIVTGLNIGADDYISKPFSKEQIQIKLEKIFKKEK